MSVIREIAAASRSKTLRGGGLRLRRLSTQDDAARAAELLARLAFEQVGYQGNGDDQD